MSLCLHCFRVHEELFDRPGKAGHSGSSSRVMCVLCMYSMHEGKRKARSVSVKSLERHLDGGV